MYEEDFAIRLTNLRTQKNVSARDMSLSIGQNPGYINNIETGKALPSMTSFFYICEFLEISPAEFFDTKNNNPKELNLINDGLKRLAPHQLAYISFLIEDLAN